MVKPHIGYGFTTGHNHGYHGIIVPLYPRLYHGYKNHGNHDYHGYQNHGNHDYHGSKTMVKPWFIFARVTQSNLT
jgi:hypothetical protein